MADYIAPPTSKNAKPEHETTGIGDLVRTRDAWLLVLLCFSLVPAYLIISGVFVSFGADAKGLDVQTAVWFVSVASILQVVGRFVIPSTSDRVGRRAAFFGVLGIMAAGVALLVGTNEMVYALAFCALSFAYGGGVTAMPAIISDRLGTANATQNIAFAELGTLLGSVVATALVNTLATTSALVTAGVLSAALGTVALLGIYRKG